MNYRCKFCGYRFKDKDEQICPECLTAREEDISCGVFGENDHSHGFYDDRYGSSATFAKNDTFRDGNANFLREERRTENRTNASRYERRNGGDINVAADPRRQYVNVQYNNPQQNRMPPSANGYPPPPIQRNNGGCSKGCVTFFVIIIFLIIAFGMLSDILEAVNGSENSEYIPDISFETENTSEPTADRGELDCFLASSERHEYDSRSEEISSFKLKNLMLAENGELVTATKAASRPIYGYYSVIRFMYTEDGSKASSDDLEITGISCDAIDAGGGVISSYQCISPEHQLYDIGDTSEITPVLYCDASADEMIVIIDTIYMGEPMSYQLNIDVQ